MDGTRTVVLIIMVDSKASFHAFRRKFIRESVATRAKCDLCIGHYFLSKR